MAGRVGGHSIFRLARTKDSACIECTTWTDSRLVLLTVLDVGAGVASARSSELLDVQPECGCRIPDQASRTSFIAVRGNFYRSTTSSAHDYVLPPTRSGNEDEAETIRTKSAGSKPAEG